MDVQVGRAVAGLKVKCVMSVSRLMFSDNVLALTQILTRMGLSPEIVQGAFWHQCITSGIDSAIDSDVILFVDHDSVFRPATVEGLLALMLQTGYDAIAPLQTKRMSNAILMSQPGVKPGDKVTIPPDWFDKPVQPVDTAHFGCTVVRTEAIKRMEKPWLRDFPDAAGEWKSGHVDYDIHFWNGFRQAGGRLGIATNISIGHAELMVSWPSLKTGTGKTIQYPHEFWGGEAPPQAHGVLQ